MNAKRPAFSSLTQALLLLSLLAISGCRNGCDAVVRYRVDPYNPVLRIGQSVNATLSVEDGCMDPVVTNQRSRSEDASVVAVDSITGRLTGIAVGEARVLVSTIAPSSLVNAAILVRVQR